MTVFHVWLCRVDEDTFGFSSCLSTFEMWFKVMMVEYCHHHGLLLFPSSRRFSCTFMRVWMYSRGRRSLSLPHPTCDILILADYFVCWTRYARPTRKGRLTLIYIVAYSISNWIFILILLNYRFGRHFYTTCPATDDTQLSTTPSRIFLKWVANFHIILYDLPVSLFEKV